MKQSSSQEIRKTAAASDLSAADYVRVLHPADGLGKISFVIIRSRDDTSTKTYDVETAPVIVDTLLDESTYVSLNRFYGPRRSDRLAQINALYLDLDVHTLPGSNQPTEEWVARLSADLKKKKIPYPSFVISSGRGLAAIWLIDPLPAKVRARWSAAMQALIGLFKPMGADSACSDCARVFRMPETTNLKSGRQVCILNGSLVRYNFDDLSDSIFIASGRPTRREIQARKKPAKKDRVPKSKRGLSPRVRFAMISRDLEKIVAHWGGTVPKGHRNTYLHLVATCLTHAEVAAELETEILCIAHQVAPSLKRREVLAIVKSAESYAARATSSNPVLDGRLHYSGARIAELLDITDELACDLGLTQIYSNRERRRRKAVREKSRRKSRGTCSRGDWLSKNSTSREKPWEGLGISRSTWYAKGYHKHNKTP